MTNAESDLQKKKELLKESEGSEVLKGDEVSSKAWWTLLSSCQVVVVRQLLIARQIIPVSPCVEPLCQQHLTKENCVMAYLLEAFNMVISPVLACPQTLYFVRSLSRLQA